MLKHQQVMTLLMKAVDERRAMFVRVLAESKPIDITEDAKVLSRIYTLCEVLGNMIYMSDLHKLEQMEGD